MCRGLCLQGGFDEDDHIQRVWELLVEERGLIEAGLDRAVNGGGLERPLWDAAGIQLAAVRAMWATPSIRAFVGYI